MPKRKHQDKDLDYLCKKLKKIEEELRRDRRDKLVPRRRVRVLSSSSDSSQDSSESHDRDVSASVTNETPFATAAGSGELTAHETAPPPPPPPDAEDLANPGKVIQPAPNKPVAAAVTDTEVIVSADNSTAIEPPEENTTEFDADILEILGIDPTNTANYGSDIQKDLAVRLEHNATEGLSKDNRKELIDLYLIPNNCKRIGPPVLNLELKAALTEPVIKRDKAIETKQKVMSAAISSLGQSITHVLSSKEKDTNLLRLLMDTGRMLCDCQHSDTLTRRNYVLSSIKKEMKESLLNAKVDTLLFGESLPDTLKTAKAINKSGSELKVNPPPKPGPSKKFTPGSSKNWRTNPPRKQATAAPKEVKETTTTSTPPATRNQRASYSRPPQTQRFTRSRR